jgi:hypothetical protein
MGKAEQWTIFKDLRRRGDDRTGNAPVGREKMSRLSFSGFRVGGWPRSSGVSQQLQLFERHGATFLAQLTAAIKEESWRLRLLSLAWTGGPVTFLALLIGFWVGYGKAPPKELYIYFGAYTVITGLISMVVGIVHRATVASRRKALENMLSEVIGKIPDLIISLRNLSTFTLSAEERRLRGAIILLSDPDATEASIQTAVEDLTGDTGLARRFRRLESFRKKGLMGLVREEAEEIEHEFRQLASTLHVRSPHAAFLLEDRLAGRIPSKRLGLRRRYGFIRRMIAAVEAGRLDEMEPADTEDLLKLLLELLMDRHFVIVRWKLAGEHPLVAASRKLEKIVLERQRLARRRRLVKYQVVEILDRMVNERPTPWSEEEMGPLPAGGEEGLYPFTLAAVPDFSKPHDFSAYRGEGEGELRQGLERILRTDRALQRLAAKEEEARENFIALRRQYQEDFARGFTEEGRQGLRIRLERDTIRFRDENKIQFARHLYAYLANLTTNRERTRVFAEAGREEQHEEPRPVPMDELKGIVLRIFAELERLLDLSEEAVVDSLEASAAININAIESSLSRRTKIGWLQAMVEEIDESAGPIALHTAERLVEHFGTRLPVPVARDLSARYELPLKGLLALKPAG